MVLKMMTGIAARCDWMLRVVAACGVLWIAWTGWVTGDSIFRQSPSPLVELATGIGLMLLTSAAVVSIGLLLMRRTLAKRDVRAPSPIDGVETVGATHESRPDTLAQAVDAEWLRLIAVKPCHAWLLAMALKNGHELDIRSQGDMLTVHWTSLLVEIRVASREADSLITISVDKAHDFGSALLLMANRADADASLTTVNGGKDNPFRKGDLVRLTKEMREYCKDTDSNPSLVNGRVGRVSDVLSTQTLLVLFPGYPMTTVWSRSQLQLVGSRTDLQDICTWGRRTIPRHCDDGKSRLTFGEVRRAAITMHGHGTKVRIWPDGSGDIFSAPSTHWFSKHSFDNEFQLRRLLPSLGIMTLEEWEADRRPVEKKVPLASKGSWKQDLAEQMPKTKMARGKPVCCGKCNGYGDFGVCICGIGHACGCPCGPYYGHDGGISSQPMD